MKDLHKAIMVAAVFAGWVASMRYKCPCPARRNDADCYRLEIFGVQPNHFVFFAFLGYVFPKYFYTVQMLGILWEVFEYYVHLDPRLLSYIGGCLNKGGNKGKMYVVAGKRKYYNPIDRLLGIRNSTKHGWHHSAAEIVVNIIGFYAGMKMRVM